MQAYWIRGVDVVPCTGRKHIEAICETPERFGFSRRTLETIFETNGESYGVDGRAASEIEIDLVRRGWKRVRELRNSVAIVLSKPSALAASELDRLRSDFTGNQLSFICQTGESWREWRGRRL